MSTRSAEQIATRQMADPHLSGINDPVRDTVPPWPLASPLCEEFQPPVGRCQGSGQLPAADLTQAPSWLLVQDPADGVTEGLACAESTATSATPFRPNLPRHGMARAAGPPHSVTEPNRRQAPPCLYRTPLPMEHRPADARHRLGNWGYAFLMPANRYTKKLVGATGFELVTPRL